MKFIQFKHVSYKTEQSFQLFSFISAIFICRVLADCGWLKKDGRNFKAKAPQSLVGENLLPARIRLYCFRGIAPPEENSAGG